MARILAFSSYVAHGHVGLRAMLPAFERLGHDVIAIPSVVLSSHAAYPRLAGTPVAAALIEQMAAALEANGWLAATEIVITGYVPTPELVTIAAALVDRVRRHTPGATYICDPVLGDDPKGLYVTPETAERIQAELLPRATIVTPNRFELSWLAARAVNSRKTAIDAALTLASPVVLATSIPDVTTRLATVLVEGDHACFTSVPLRRRVPSGTGDLFTALYAAYVATGRSGREALAFSGACLEEVLSVSAGRDELCLVPLFSPAPPPLPVADAAPDEDQI